MKTAIVMLNDLSIATKYDGEPSQGKYGGEWGWASHSSHVQVPEGMDHECVKAELDEDGVVQLVEDQDMVAAKVQRGRDNKLAKMKEMRKPKLAEVDIMVNELALGDRSDAGAIQLYRNQLRDITDSFKDNEGAATAAIDSLEEDLSDLVWPGKP